MIIRRQGKKSKGKQEWAPVPIEKVGRLQKAALIVGLIIAITGAAALTANVVYFFSEKEQLAWGVFAFTWGTVARHFQWTVRRGLKRTLSEETSQRERDLSLGSQKWFLGVMERLVELEILVSIGWLLFVLNRP